MITISDSNGQVVTYLELPDVGDILRRVIARQVREVTVDAMNTNRPDTLKTALSELLKIITGIRFYSINTRAVMDKIWDDIRSDINLVDFYVNITNEFYAHYMTTMGVMPKAGVKNSGNQMDALVRLMAGSITAAFPPPGCSAESVVADPEFVQSHIEEEHWIAAFRANPWFMVMYLIRVVGITPDDVVMFVYPNLGQHNKGK